MISATPAAIIHSPTRPRAAYSNGRAAAASTPALPTRRSSFRVPCSTTHRMAPLSPWAGPPTNSAPRCPALTFPPRRRSRRRSSVPSNGSPSSPAPRSRSRRTIRRRTRSPATIANTDYPRIDKTERVCSRKVALSPSDTAPPFSSYNTTLPIKIYTFIEIYREYCLSRNGFWRELYPSHSIPLSVEGYFCSIDNSDSFYILVCFLVVCRWSHNRRWWNVLIYKETNLLFVKHICLLSHFCHCRLELKWMIYIRDVTFKSMQTMA